MSERKRTLSDSSITISTSQSPRSKRGVSELGDSNSDAEVSLGASHLHIMDPNDSPIDMGVESQSTAMPIDDAMERLPLYSEANGMNVVGTELEVFDDNLDAGEDSDDVIPSPDQQLKEIAQLCQRELVKGEDWYLISRLWYRRWQVACSGIAESKEDDLELGIDAVGPINSDSITDDEGNLKKPLLLDVEVVAVPKKAWQLLESWYGTDRPAFIRPVVGTSAFASERIEFYLPTFYPYKTLTETSDAVPTLSTSVPAIPLSSGSTLNQLKIIVSHVLNYTRPIRFYRLPADFNDGGQDSILPLALLEPGVELVDESNLSDASTLSDALFDEEIIRLAVEQQDVDGKWFDFEASRSSSAPTVYGPPPPSVGLFSAGKFGESPATSSNRVATSKATTTNLTPRYKNGTVIAAPSNPGYFSGIGQQITSLRNRSAARSLQPGLVGLHNLGNTCFMNSALQCMSNTKELKEYFVSGYYKQELNPENPLGMGGQVAEAFGALIQRMWASNVTGAVPPREFKHALSKFAPSFSGYGQQDSQELLAFLLDGIHEDLNRIKSKPATNSPDWEGGGDRELLEMANACWEQYRSRNNSVIVDLFQGQYRSTVVCPDCDKVSITFDPFMYVTTNLPVKKIWTGNLKFVPLDPTKTVTMVKFEHPLSGTIKSMKVAIGGFMNVDPKNLFVMEEWSHKFFKAWRDSDSVAELTANDFLVFYETAIHFPQVRVLGSRFKLAPTPAVAPISPPSTIIIPVFHTVRNKPPVRHVAAAEGDFFGSPFLLSLSPEEASSISLIRRALMVRYAGLSTLGDQMLDLLAEMEEEDKAIELAASMDGEDIVMAAVDGIQSPTPMVLDEAPLASTSTLPPADSVPTSSSRALPPSHTTKALLRIRVSRDTLPYVPSAQGECGRSMVDLETRLPRSTSSSSDIFPTASTSTLPAATTSTTSIPLITTSNGLPTIASATEESAAIDDDSTQPVPLLHLGDHLIVEWTPAAYEMYFGKPRDDQPLSKWEVLDQFIDPEYTRGVAEAKAGTPKKTISIVDCLNEFTTAERLGEDDMWYCPVCKEHKQATKKVQIWKVPDVLVFALKRFSAARQTHKLDDFVDFPLEGFNLEPFVEGDLVERRLAAESKDGSIAEPESLIYDLYAVDNHYGGVGGGHYTAYAKNHDDNKWYDFDDTRVSPIDAEQVRTKAAYLLFYRRRTTRPIGANILELVESAIQSRNASHANSEAAGSPPRSPFDDNDTSPPSDVEEGGFVRGGLDSTNNFYNQARGLSAARSMQAFTRHRATAPEPRRPYNSDNGSDTEGVSETEADRGGSDENDEDDEHGRVRSYPLSTRYVQEDDDYDTESFNPNFRSGGSPDWALSPDRAIEDIIVGDHSYDSAPYDPSMPRFAFESLD